MSTSNKSSDESLGKTPNQPVPTGGLLSGFDQADTKSTETNFQSSDIGTKTAQKVDAFEKHRAEAAKKAEDDAKKRKKITKNTRITLSLIACALVILIGTVITLLVLNNKNQPDEDNPTVVTSLPQISTGSIEEIRSIANTALNTTNDGYALEYVEELFTQVEEAPENESYQNEILLAKVTYYASAISTGLTAEEKQKVREERVTTFDQIDPSGFNDETMVVYLNMGSLIYQAIDKEKAEEFYQQLLAIDEFDDIRGDDGGDE